MPRLERGPQRRDVDTACGALVKCRCTRKESATRDAVRLRLDLMYIGERELHVNPLKGLANDENEDPRPSKPARAIASGLARRAAEAERDAKRLRAANPLVEPGAPAAPVSYKFQTEDQSEEMVVDFEFA